MPYNFHHKAEDVEGFMDCMERLEKEVKEVGDKIHQQQANKDNKKGHTVGNTE